MAKDQNAALTFQMVPVEEFQLSDSSGAAVVGAGSVSLRSSFHVSAADRKLRPEIDGFLLELR